jgi:SAM-dependent methyltransferase
MELAKLIDPDVYDTLYKEDDKTHDDLVKSPYYPMFCAAIDRVISLDIKCLLEVGCGSGTLAEMVIARNIPYRGFDISSVGIEKAKTKNHMASFFTGSATDPLSYNCEYDGILCCEVLEHIPNDLEAISLWRRGTKVVCSVPNFDYTTHYRLFRNKDEVVQRYGALIDIQTIDRIAKPVLPHRTFVSYLGSLRWAASQGNYKRVAGLLGIRKFDWHAGWFLFSGIRN